MGDLSAEKKRLRRRVLAARDGIPAAERDGRSAALCGRFARELGEGLREGAVVAGFFPLGSEVDLRLFLREAAGRGCLLALPCMVKAAHMEFVEVGAAELDAGRLPFLARPAQSVASDDPALSGRRVFWAAELDVLAVPLVAFDAKGGRLGYGGGNYDRFLGDVRKDALVFGVAFAEQRVDAVPVEPHDVPLPRIEVA